mmetsp:Transcript_23433/g.34710  ORF Transcript_23433/g.34710 Transcript_23433/m.34710 type:complete len:274 (+) Transcript_23433:920-1741(+)
MLTERGADILRRGRDSVCESAEGLFLFPPRPNPNLFFACVGRVGLREDDVRFIVGLPSALRSNEIVPFSCPRERLLSCTPFMAPIMLGPRCEFIRIMVLAPLETTHPSPCPLLFDDGVRAAILDCFSSRSNTLMLLPLPSLSVLDILVVTPVAADPAGDLDLEASLPPPIEAFKEMARFGGPCSSNAAGNTLSSKLANAFISGSGSKTMSGSLCSGAITLVLDLFFFLRPLDSRPPTSFCGSSVTSEDPGESCSACLLLCRLDFLSLPLSFVP